MGVLPEAKLSGFLSGDFHQITSVPKLLGHTLEITHLVILILTLGLPTVLTILTELTTAILPPGPIRVIIPQ